MESKYYTPDIKEFRVGFEYQVRDTMLIDKGWHITKEPVWNSYKFEFDNYLSAYYLTDKIKQKSYTNDVRVKYLDRQDIEGLGFIIVKEQNKAFQARKYFTYNIKSTGEEYNNVEGYWDIIVSGDMYCVINKECMGLTTFFRGEIKNKSELKELLEKIGISYNS